MSQEALFGRISGLADAVVADSRWVRDDLNVSILGMVLYGFAMASGRHMRLVAADVYAAVLRCMTERIGAATKWSEGLVAEASVSARDKAHHPGNRELIGVGQTYHGVADLTALVDNVFANFASVRQRAGLPPAAEPMITVFLNPLSMLLAARERQKGSPLTEAEVLEVRDGAACTQMPRSQAERFYAALDVQMPIARLDPERIWEEWQAVRDRVE